MFDENVEKVTGRIVWADLSEPLEDVLPADWVLLLEVGEHIHFDLHQKLLFETSTNTIRAELLSRGVYLVKVDTFTLTI